MNTRHQQHLVRCLYLYDAALILVGVFFVWWAIVCFMGGVDARPPTMESTVAGVVFLGIGVVVMRCAYGLMKSTRTKAMELKERRKKEAANKMM